MQTPNNDYVFVRVLGFPQKFLARLPAETPSFYAKEVLLRTEQGDFLGFVNSFPFTSGGDAQPAKVIRAVEAHDREKAQQIEKKGLELREEIRDLVNEFSLEMKITHVQLSLDETMATVFYTAPQRVDFRNLVKRLRDRYAFKTTLKQISQEEREACFHVDPRIM